MTSPRSRRLRAVLVVLALAACADVPASTCHGTVAHGRLDGGVALPLDGDNFSAYTSLARVLGRTYVHARVRTIVVAAYASLARSQPGWHYVYGETGLAAGGRMRPHRTHQNGLSVDFFVPVRDAAGRPSTLPMHVLNRYGYSIEFDRDGRWEGYSIDFAALAAHLRALAAAAASHDAGIERVIFEPAWLARLYATPDGAWLRSNLHFLPRQAWVRHDEHYHVDFSVPCRPLR